MNPITFSSRFSKIFYTLLLYSLLSGLIACNNADPDPAEITATADPTNTLEPTASPFPTATETVEFTFKTPEPIEATPIPAWFEGVFIDLPESLASINPSQTDSLTSGQLDPNLPAGQRVPDHNRFLVDGWPIDHLTQQPRILAFPARDYASVNVRAQLEIDLLKSLLTTGQPSDNLDKLPFLPVTNQAQLINSQLADIPFQSGAGLRYVTLLSNPENKPELLYVWQGITADGRGVVSAIFPIEIAAAGPESSTEALRDQIDSLSATGFAPPLTQLDQIIQSITANLPEPELVFDESGKVDLTIVYPRNGGETLIGRQLELEGYVQPGTEQQVELSLTSGVNTLAAQTTISEIDGWWQATLNIPPNVRGEAQLTAKSGNQIVERLITLVDDPAANSTSIELQRPSTAERWVAGHPLYFEGAVLGNLVDDTLSIGLFVDSCQTLVAKHSLTLLPEDTAWHAVLNIPQGVSGRGCAVAWTGEYGDADWREIQVPLTILAQPAETAQIMIGNPVNLPLSAGNATVYGIAFAPEPTSISIKINLQDGTLVTEGVSKIDEDNQWSFQFEVPNSATGRLFVEASLDGPNSAANIISIPLSQP